MYDLIGDIHGYATPLKQLLKKMDYVKRDGIWQHPERKVIFLGDFVDRGPEQVETVQIARAMVEGDSALAVMGNHEFNAVAWTTPDPNSPDEYLRSHNNEKNHNQHKEFLRQVAEGSDQHSDMINWFKTLPLYLDLDGLRVVHACWHPDSLKTLAQFTDHENRVLPDAWPALAHKEGVGYNALEIVLKGLEIALPTGHEFPDKDRHPRRDIRTRWWKEPQDLTYRDLALVGPEVIGMIPRIPVPDGVLPGYDGKKPLFLGHYWLTGHPALLSKHIACLDYSIAAEHTNATEGRGKLCAYRWQGERELSAQQFIWVP
ncbi:metallophosphoesterase [Alcaligenaceae bacterium]|nr:metallophosphoesterase [Alcaligenaceae bacterium]